METQDTQDITKIQTYKELAAALKPGDRIITGVEHGWPNYDGLRYETFVRRTDTRLITDQGTYFIKRGYRVGDTNQPHPRRMMTYKFAMDALKHADYRQRILFTIAEPEIVRWFKEITAAETREFDERMAAHARRVQEDKDREAAQLAAEQAQVRGLAAFLRAMAEQSPVSDSDRKNLEAAAALLEQQRQLIDALSKIV